MPTHDGAWFIAFDEAGREEAEIKGRWSILHLDRTGKIDSVQPATQDYVSECMNERCTNSESYEVVVVGDHLVSNLSASVFDWNADGKDELFVHLYLAYLGGDSEGGRIWTYRKRAIELYPPARELRVTGLSDVDTDGRPDVLVTLGSGVRMSPCTNRRASTDTLELAGHALDDGTFSFKDDVAIGFAKRKCPPPAARLTAQVEALCARVWGQSSAHVAAALDRGCKALKDVCDTDCEDRDALSYVTHDLRIPVVIPPNAR